jgi:hypothetical protein
MILVLDPDVGKGAAHHDVAMDYLCDNMLLLVKSHELNA